MRTPEKAVSRTPPRPGILSTRGDAYVQSGDEAKGRDALERSLEIDPSSPTFKSDLPSPALAFRTDTMGGVPDV